MATNSEFSNIDLVKFFIQNFKKIIIFTVIVAIASIVVAMLITPKFKSSAIIFPSSTSSISKDLLTDISRASKNILRFGNEEEAEQLLQILQSESIKTRIINKYDLMKHYEIESDSEYPKTELMNEYNKNITTRKTQYQAVEITVVDTDPQYAADIANDITKYIDTIYNEIQKERAQKALTMIKEVYEEQKIYVKYLSDSIKKVSNKNEAELLLLNSEEEIKKLSLLKAKYTEAKVDANSSLSHKYIVNKAMVSEKKSYPVRWLIVSLSTISGFIFIFFLLLIIEKFKAIKQELF